MFKSFTGNRKMEPGNSVGYPDGYPDTQILAQPYNVMITNVVPSLKPILIVVFPGPCQKNE